MKAARGGSVGRYAPVVGIGEAASSLGVTPMALRVYERKGLVVPARSGGGRRLFSAHDLALLRCVRQLIVEEGVNIEGVRHLLALIPCWRHRRCAPAEAAGCPARTNPRMPCWALPKTACRERVQQCRDCVVYRTLPGCRHLRARARQGALGGRRKGVSQGGTRHRSGSAHHTHHKEGKTR